MIWIVHGTRRKTDKEKFDIMMWHSKPVDVKENERSIPSYIKKRGLLYEWGDSSVPVFFDFDDDILWCLWPKICVDSTYIFKIERNFLITALQARQEDNSFEKILKHWLSAIEINEWRKKKQDLQKRCIFP